MANENDQVEVIRSAREALGMTNSEIADELGVKLETVLAWLAPDNSKKSRGMPEVAKRMLERIVKEPRSRKRRPPWLGRR